MFPLSVRPRSAQTDTARLPLSGCVGEYFRVLEASPLYPELLEDAVKFGLHKVNSASVLPVKQCKISAGWLRWVFCK